MSNLKIMKYNKPIIIAEIGCNHKGDIKIAKKMIESAKDCGADYVKFQKRDNKELLGKSYSNPHPNPENSYGKTYGQHRDFLEFSLKQHKELFKFCKKINIGFSTSVWDVSSAKIICKNIRMDFVKVPSACNTNLNLISTILGNFKKKVHVSLGMTTSQEIQNIIKIFKKKKRIKDLVLYACTSDYPANTQDLCLLEVQKISKLEKKIFAVGFSGHHLGIAADIAAYTLGARYIERHFTLDRTWKGTDHAASLEPPGLKKLVRDLNLCHQSLKHKPKNGILKAERSQRKKLKFLS